MVLRVFRDMEMKMETTLLSEVLGFEGLKFSAILEHGFQELNPKSKP